MTTEEERPNDHPQLPPGFRFHPTDEELLIHYLKKKVSSSPQPVSIIADVDLYKFDPWDLPGLARFGEKEWYFFSPRDRKYPNGARPNRAARSGYWKATGTDKPVLISGTTHKVGVKKALVFYTGRPPKGSKTNWIMHEYRLTDTAPAPPRRKGSLRLDDWVLCRIYKKLGPFLRMEGSEGEAEDSLGESMGVPTTMAAAAGQQAYQGGPKFDSFTGLLQIEEQANFLDGFLETSDANGGLPRQGMAYNDSVSSKLNSLKRNLSLVFTDEIEDLYTSSPSSKKPTNHTNNFSSASASINGSNLLKATMGSYTDLQQLYTLPPYADNRYWSTETGQPWLTWTT